ncbi:hypothetical protein AB0F13_01270 [Streptomyces sp. NPDC026206]|uniref:hypothetical protein n=1 Tax=Streptomyces sp. NPDC026206 TaxID=3157089 RepID=UPI0034083178
MSALSPRRLPRSLKGTGGAPIAFRAAVASAALASALLAPATAAFAAEPATPAIPAAPSAPAKAAEQTAGTTAPAKADEKTGTKKDAAAEAETGKKTEAGKGAAKAKETEKVYGSWWLHRTVTLDDGSVVKVYESGPETHRADVVVDGKVVKSFTANGKDVTVDYNGMKLTLTALNGEIRTEKVYGSWWLHRTVTLDDGSVVKVYESGPETHRADVVVDGKVVKSFTANGKDVTVDYNGMKLTLTALNGEIRTKGADTATTTGSEAKATNASTRLVPSGAAQTRAVPQGGVAAGAEGVRDGNDTALLAAGGALASVSAAGIAFAVLRRRAVGAGV